MRYEAACGIEREVTVPADLVAAMIFKATARQRFEQLARPEQRSLLVWLDQAADAQERNARINDLLDRLQRGDPI
ncbi:MAG: YdeI/OmpD-associated family protein [Anaerolineales bacterium]|nr:YdeI/OmpD-associated family protein [Anaerolineales bacterium]